MRWRDASDILVRHLAEDVFVTHRVGHLLRYRMGY